MNGGVMSTRIKTDYPGVFYREAPRTGGKGFEHVYYVVYKKNGKLFEEKAGRQFQNNMTPAKAANIRGELIEGKRPSRKEKRALEEAEKRAQEAERKAQENRWTIQRLWGAYSENRPPGKSLSSDSQRYEKYIQGPFGEKMPSEILALDVDRLRITLAKTLAPQTVKHVLDLLTWIANYGAKKGICDGVKFHIKKPTVNNTKTEYLTGEQIGKLLEAIDNDPNYQVGNLMKLALFTGMRKGELLNLQWKDLDFDRGFITIRDPKGGKDQIIPMNENARQLLEAHPREARLGTKSAYVFPGRYGQRRASIDVAARKIIKAAGLPEGFRPLHGLRHSFASMLASSGEVDMYVLQRLMTHKDPRMTQRYAHLRDETLKKASQVAGDIVAQALKPKKKQPKVVSIER
jgi:integrase